MAMLLIEGFDQYSNDAEMQRGGWVFSTTSSVQQIASPIHGTLGRAIEIISTNSFAGHAFAPSSATYVVGYAFQSQDTGPQNHSSLKTYQGGTVQNQLSVKSDGEIDVYRATGNLLGTTTGAGLIQGSYQYIELKIFLHASTGTVDVWVDGINVLSLTSQNTLNTATAEIDNIQLLGQNSADPAYDSVYVLDDSGSDNTDRLGEVFVETIVADADGNVNDFTPSTGANWENVDDIAPADDDSTYNHSTTATDQDLYGMAALAGNIGTVFAVEASALVRKEDPGERLIRIVARSNVTEVESGDKGFGVGYRNVTHIFENDPDGGVDWDEASVNAAEFGIVLEQ